MNLNIIRNYLIPRTILDIGANIGDFYKNAHNEFSDATYTLVEANPECLPYLQALPVEHHIAVLSDSIKPVVFYTNKQDARSTGASVYRENTHHFSDENLVTTVYQSTTLDILFPDRVFDLIKMDVQGSELDIIKGAPNIISTCKGLLLELSCIPYNHAAPLEQEVITYLRDIGFIEVEELSTLYNNEHLLIQRDVLFINKAL
jgi:FkbM family methyltransferase